MTPDFYDAHERHWEDAELLERELRLATADQLYGIAAECGLKRLMLCFGMPFNNDMPSDKRDCVHANKIWDRYTIYAAGHNGVGYLLSAVNPFSDWDIAQRYGHRSEFDTARITPHRQGAELVRQKLAQAKREGLI